ncbi:MAG: polymer-forming cytoskeletal protein [Elusimicrobiales bacterium]|nr:polymer-forming cytoskeletal protein [Elusimicrobiales bacterium]HOJ86297.1 polymer-forming cytoskeletal protein [Elusimicrobiales bacterium]HOL63219.1 polymer-forming cytoskeletal protein [Elusimicrobiales bacterium]HPO95972.1 polymer-forming cytoskeletal protein [Elusimicrobiales bacterium]
MALIKEKISELTSSESVISADCIFTGNIVTKGSIKIEGTVDGSVSEAKEVFISKTAKITGDISGEKCVIYGNVKGNILASDMVEIMSSASVEGDVTALRIMIEEGANFNGKITMRSKK